MEYEMKRLIGDVHGKYGAYKAILKNSPYPTIQVGDMGVGFFKWPHGEACTNPPFEKMVKGDHKFIRGNHDNPAVCQKHTQWIPDGTIENGVMYIGGALSIDRAFRIEGFSWWPKEELSIAELNQLVDKYIEAKPRVMITHECPDLVANELVRYIGRDKFDDPSRTRQAFQSMWSAHSPEVWVFGHWHHSFDHVLNGTRFKCLAELECFDLEI
jgi:hypothetical protein